MTSLKFNINVAAILAFILIILASPVTAQDQTAPPNMPYKLFAVGSKVFLPQRESLDGKPVRINESLGKKIVVLAFWLNTCDVCIEQMKELRDVIREHKLQDQLVVYTVVRAADAIERDMVADMYKESGLDWPVIVDPDVTLAKQFAVTIVPAFHIIAKDRILLTRQTHTIRTPLRNLSFEDMLIRAVKGETIPPIEFEKPSTSDIQRALIGKPAPDFSLKDVYGDTYALADSVEEHPLLLIFWHPTCPPCVKAMPVLQDHLRTLMKQYDFKILSIADIKGESQEREALNFIDRYDLPFPVLSDSGAAVGKAYHVNHIPCLYFIDIKGNVHEIVSDMSAELDKIIDPIIAEIATPLPGKSK